MKKFDKLFTALKYYLIGKNYYKALKALQFAREHHSGFRKDGSTPEFHHQLAICMYLMTLKNVENEETVLITALLHDTIEDSHVSPEEMEEKFGKEVAQCVWLLTKQYKNEKKNTEAYFSDISKNAVASLVKGADRIHNVQTMINVFSKEKQIAYLKEVETYFLPMIKKAKYSFPEQGAAYYNIQHMLESQIQLFNAIHKKD
jgi:(p)ppGpp synthase/HD superfamily hydrolase